MIMVKILGFGSNWWARFGRDPLDRHRYTRHAAYFNSTGVQCGRKMRRYWIVPGVVRFNGVGDFNPQFPNRSLGVTFECADVALAWGGNRLLFMRKASPSTLPDYYLIVVSSDRCGAFNFGDPSWKSECVTPLAVSHMGGKQEALLLMKPLDWVRSSLGIWQLSSAANLRHGASLKLLEDLVVS
jgi:hypothetical protein